MDNRVIRVGIEVEPGTVNWYEDLHIRATGTKSANETQNSCSVTIHGLSRAVRNRIITDTSPMLKGQNRRRLILEVGRVSTGTHCIFIGDIVSSTPSEPPDVSLTLEAKTENSQAMNVVSVSKPGRTTARDTAQTAADTMGLGLIFEADDKQIQNWSHTGDALSMVKKLNANGDTRAFIDDDKLVVTNAKRAVSGRSRILNVNTGMIGLPRVTETGVEVTFLIDNEQLLGGALEIESEFNPAANGSWGIDQLRFDVSNYENAFYYVASCSRW